MGLTGIWVRRSGTWVPLQRAVQIHRPADGWRSIYARMRDRQDEFFGLKATADLNLEDYAVRVWDGDDWAPGRIAMSHDNISQFGVDRTKWDRAIEGARQRAA